MSLGLKQQYNKALERHKKAEEFFNKASPEEYDKWLPEYQKIIVKLSQLIYKIQKELGRELTQGEALEGFKEV